ncbi:MAG: hypothetical protein ACREV5_15605 [Steroidobacter sp.]
MRNACSLGLPAIAIAFSFALSAAPAPAADAKTPPKIIRLEPKKMAGVEQGKAVVVKGKAGPQPHRFGLEKLTYMMPVAVAVRPVNKGDEVGLKVTKYAWNQPLREGATNGDILRYVFRTEGEFQVAVEAKKAGTPYRLMVWVGDETKPEFAPVVVKASEYQGETRKEGGMVLWVIAGALIIIVALLGALVLRRKSS